MLIFEIIILGHKNKYLSEFRDALMKIEHEKFIIYETGDIKIAHIFLCNYLGINFNIESGLKIYTKNKWSFVNNPEITMNIHKDIKNKAKLHMPELIIPFKIIYSLKNGEYIRLKSDGLSKKGWKCKTLHNKDIESYKQELNDYINEHNIHIIDNFRHNTESSIEYNYRIQQQILHYLNPNIKFEL